MKEQEYLTANHVKQQLPNLSQLYQGFYDAKTAR
jgi:hypothetical protein